MKNHTLANRMLVPHGLLTPAGLLTRAAILAVIFLLCHAAGWRDYATVLCGTDPSSGATHLQAFLGLIYVLAFLAFTVAAPILALASAVLCLLNRWLEQPGGASCGSN